MDSDSYPAENSGRLTNSVANNTMNDNFLKGMNVWTRR